jgi:hypothetical protein
MGKTHANKRQPAVQHWSPYIADDLYFKKRDAQTGRLARRRASSQSPAKAAPGPGPTNAAMRWGSLAPALRAVFNGGYQTTSGPVRGFASDQHLLLRKFVASLPRAVKRKATSEGNRPQRLLSGKTKAQVGVGDSKMLALFDHYVCLNATMRSWIRIDIDQSFGSVTALRDAICKAGVPPPNLVVCQISNSNVVQRPHLYYAIDTAVCFTRFGSIKAKLLFRAIELRLTQRLSPVGADLGGLSNPLRGKNPLSPFWQTHVLAEQPYQLSSKSKSAKLNLVSLSEILRLHEFAGNKYDLQDSPPVSLACLPDNSSNSLFDRVRYYAYRNVATYRNANKEDEFYCAVSEHAQALCTGNEKISDGDVAQRVSHWTWQNYNGQAADHPRLGRGRLSKSCRGMTLPERQAVGGRASAALRRERSIARQAAVVTAMWAGAELAPGTFPSDHVLASRVECSTRTIARCRLAL